jgi:hypothetical protein
MHEDLSGTLATLEDAEIFFNIYKTPTCTIEMNADNIHGTSC